MFGRNCCGLFSDDHLRVTSTDYDPQQQTKVDLVNNFQPKMAMTGDREARRERRNELREGEENKSHHHPWIAEEQEIKGEARQ